MRDESPMASFRIGLESVRNFTIWVSLDPSSLGMIQEIMTKECGND